MVRRPLSYQSSQHALGQDLRNLATVQVEAPVTSEEREEPFWEGSPLSLQDTFVEMFKELHFFG